MTPLFDGQVIALEKLTRRHFCKLAGAGLVTLGACGLPDPQRVGTGPLGDTTNDPNGGGGEDLAGEVGNPDLEMGHQNGPVDMAHGQGGPVDMAHGQGGPTDMATKQPADMAMNQANACGGGVTDTGTKPASVGMNQAVYVKSQQAFLCHDANGFFAVSSQCTHQGATMSFSGGAYHCPRHGAVFTYTGAVSSGPNGGPLDHYTLCTTNNGTIGIDTNTIVASNKRFAL